MNVGRLRPEDPDGVASFRLIGRIGSGGMGVVYLAEGPDGRQAAVKVIRSDLADDPGFRHRFAQEVAAARRVRSPVTAAVLAADATADRPWVAFEYIDAPNLAVVVANGVPRLSAGLGILSGVAEALVAIHRAGLVHRDLKPANVLVAPGGAVVIDFGIAAALNATTLTHSGVIGTPGWLAPEQIRGQRVTPATDIFAWGALAMYITTGRHPFGSADDAPAVYLYRIVNEPANLEGLPPQLFGVVSAALSRDPTARPSASDLVRALLPAAAPDAQTAPLPDTQTAPRPGAALGTRVMTPLPPTEPDGSPVVSGRKRKWWMLAGGAVPAIVLVVAVIVASTMGKGHGSGTATTTPPTTPGASESAGHASTLSPTTSPPTSVSKGVATTTPGVAAVAVSTCPTQFGVPGDSSPAVPSSLAAPAAAAKELEGYSNGFISFLAPAGWSCTGSVGADGGETLSAFPAGQSEPVGGTSVPFDAEAVYVFLPSQGLGPSIYLACPFFLTAAALETGISCPTPPTGEITHPDGANVVEFEDPPGLKGDAPPSGGSYPANGVVVWDASTKYAAEAVCTLPQQRHSICTAVLDDFLSRYGTPPAGTPPVS